MATVLDMRKALESTELKELQARNAARAAAAKQKLGPRYVFHKENLVRREPYTFLLKNKHD